MPHDQLAVAPLTGEYYEEVGHPLMGPASYQTYPMRFSRVRPPLIPRPAPLVGQHNHEILGEVIGMTPEEIEELEQLGVVGDRPRPRT